MPYTQTYEDWYRQLDACACMANVTFQLAHGAALGISRAEVLGILNAKYPDEASAAWKCAKALGIAKRRHLNFTGYSTSYVSAAVPYVGFARLVAERDIWFGRWCPAEGEEGTIEVTGHPSLESAQEHLERLIGRYLP